MFLDELGDSAPHPDLAAMVGRGNHWVLGNQQSLSTQRNGDGRVLPRSITKLPVGLTWPSRPGITLLGDAANLMPPAGQGANMAMLDGALLGLALAAHPDDCPAAVKEYEHETFERTSAAAQQSAHVQEILMSPDASQKMLEFFQPG